MFTETVRQEGRVLAVVSHAQGAHEQQPIPMVVWLISQM